MGAGNERVQSFDFVNESMLNQKIQRTIRDRWLRSETRLAQPFKDRIGAKRLVVFQQHLQHLASNGCKAKVLFLATRICRRDSVGNAGGMVMLFEPDADGFLAVLQVTCHVITYRIVERLMLYNHIGNPMSRKLLSLSISATLFGSVAWADTPNVAVDIAPVHSLVARVMDGVGSPVLIVQPGASPHEYSLRPSDAAALQDADLVFWVGEDLTPWLEGAIETLSENADVTSLMEAEGAVELELRESALFEAHDHEAHADSDNHDHDDHNDHENHDEHDDDHAEEKDHDDHDHDEHAEHDHGSHDTHVWLSPENAAIWLNLIAGKLSASDPDNASAYFSNAAAAREEIEALKTEINEILEPARGKEFIVFHDAYQYFEVAFDIPAAGAISLSDASDPSPARIAEIQGRIRAEGIDCVLAEPQYDPKLVQTVLDGTEANTGVSDPIGANIEPGPSFYPQLLRNLATTLSDCL